MAGWFLFAASAVLLFVAIWIVVPAPNLVLLAFAVLAPEVSPVLLAGALAVAVSAPIARGRPMRVTVAMAIVASLLYAWPIARLPFAIRRFNDTFAALPRIVTSQAAGSGVMPFGVTRPDVEVVRGVPFARAGGVPLALDIYRPRDREPRPIVMQIYGGAWRSGEPGDDAMAARRLASIGYLVVAIDYRHAPAWRWPAQIEDVDAAIDWVIAHAQRYGGDPARIALVGRSAGGQLALTAAYRQRGRRIAGVVSYYGPTDLADGWRTPPRPDPLPVRPVLEAYLGGTPDTAAAGYRDASPIAYVSADVPPTLLLYGARDHIVEARFGRDLHRRLQAAGAQSLLLEIPWAEHAFDALPWGLSGQLSQYYVERFLASALGR